MSAEGKIPYTRIIEKVAVLEADMGALTDRVDKFEGVLHEDLSEIKQELKEVIAWMNRGKGWAAAALLLAGILGGIASKLMFLLFPGH